MTTPPHPAFCACCEPEVPLAPALIDNRPGLSEIAWRPGRYATFRQAMIEQLTRGPRNPLDPGDPRWPAEVRSALSALTTRDDADYGIMLIDLFAAVSDVLAFYSERQANEMFLRTARERDSLLRLSRLIGYLPSPGVAATTALAFTLDAGAQVSLARGMKVMSVPGQDERPQTFETIAAIKADARLNDLPAFGAPQAFNPFAAGSARLPIVSRPDHLVAGDKVLLLGGAVEIQEVRSLETEVDGEYLEFTRSVGLPATGITGFKLKRELSLFGHDVPGSYQHYDPAQLPANRWSTRTLGTHYSAGLMANRPSYALDRTVDDLKTGELMLFDCGPGASPRFTMAIVTGVERGPATLGPLAATVDWVKLQPVLPFLFVPAFLLLASTGLPQISDLRQTRAYVLDGHPVIPRSYRYPAALSGSTLHVPLNRIDDPSLLRKKSWIAISNGKTRHVARITGTTQLPPGQNGVGHVAVGFEPALPSPMADARVNGNVAAASHGETQPDETLGHGDGTRSFQAFRLQRGPLSRIPGSSGIDPVNELAVRVNGELWQEASSFHGRTPTERVYTVRTGDDGVSTIAFGDGKTGARLPSGASNIIARYRTGLGDEGRLKADQLTTLLSRPVGLRSVTNPLPTDGGLDPETLAIVRTAAPATVRTFGRAISLMDFEDVARQTGLVARAKANWAWVGLERAIQLTVAGAEGARLSTLAMATLVDALRTVRDPNHLLIVGNLWRVPLVIEARLMRESAFEADMVEANARAALDALFDFDRQPLGRAVHLSHVSAALQGAKGVAAVDIDRFHIKGAQGWTAAQLMRRGASAAAVQQHVRIFDARPLKPIAQLDPLSIAGLALDGDIRALPAEQAFIAAPALDLALTVVESL